MSRKIELFFGSAELGKTTYTGLLGIKFWVDSHFDRRKSDVKNLRFRPPKICIFWNSIRQLQKIISPDFLKLQTWSRALRIAENLLYISSIGSMGVWQQKLCQKSTFRKNGISPKFENRWFGKVPHGCSMIFFAAKCSPQNSAPEKLWFWIGYGGNTKNFDPRTWHACVNLYEISPFTDHISHVFEATTENNHPTRSWHSLLRL